MLELARRAIEAHGGLDLWRQASEIRIELSAGGLAFASKLQGSAVRATEVRISTADQSVVFEDFPREGRRGVLEPDGSVRIETSAGEVLDRRADPRSRFSDMRHRLWWDRMDILYFGTCAIWTYLSAPFVFAREGYELTELDPWEEEGERWERLGVRFPSSVHTHSREQVFYIDAAGLIRRHDYTAEPIGAWAKAAHYCTGHETFDGLIVPTRRFVYPRRPDNRPRAHPRLVWIEVPTARVVRGQAAGGSVA